MAALAGLSAYAQDSDNAHQATGVKVGEVTPDSAVLWTRRTQTVRRLNEGIKREGRGQQAKRVKPGEDIRTFEGACPGAPGQVRAILEPASGAGRKQTLDWIELDPAGDFTHQFALRGLKPATDYKFAVETRASRGAKSDALLTGKFRTAPEAVTTAPVQFALLSCQAYQRKDRPNGFAIYNSIEKWNPDFLLGCGDNVYYDSEDPVADSVAVARFHWDRMFSLPTLRSCLRNVPGYWQFDDHDLWDNDCFPGMAKHKTAPLTLDEGRRVFRHEVPCPREPNVFYRTFRWGTEVEIWLPDGRNYRAANDAPDGPTKSLWGVEQRKWLEKTLVASRARWKIMINPNPIVGPDHARKNDNHANPAFAHEGLAFRKWLKDNVSGRVVVMNGDRHWQYHSVDPETGLHEFGCGPASDGHAVPPSRGEDPRYHKFLRIKGGFLAVRLDPSNREQHLTIEHRDVDGATVHRQTFARPA